MKASAGFFLRLFFPLLSLSWILVFSPVRANALSLEGNGGWVDGKGTVSPPVLSGKVVLYDFWDYTCINCLRTLPHLERLYQKYHDKGLEIVGIHSPEFDFAAKPERVEKAIALYHVNFPVVLDRNQILWNRFRNHYWPSDYLYAQDETLLYHSIGEGDYEELESHIVAALHLTSAASSSSSSADFPENLTPELYAGTDRGHLGNPGGYRSENSYYLGHTQTENSIILSGLWSSKKDHVLSGIKSQRSYPRMTVYYQGTGVNAVMRQPAGHSRGTVLVTIDGHPLPRLQAGADARIENDGSATVAVSGSRMYSLVTGQPFGPHRLDLVFFSPGTSLYTLTFNP